jgi:hypothetical protein
MYDRLVVLMPVMVEIIIFWEVTRSLVHVYQSVIVIDSCSVYQHLSARVHSVTCYEMVMLHGKRIYGEVIGR